MWLYEYMIVSAQSSWAALLPRHWLLRLGIALRCSDPRQRP
jgi:hypothetical protein